MEQAVAPAVSSTTQGFEIDEMTKKEFIHIIKCSLKGKPLTDREATMLFFWARHQNAPEFDFVPAEYRAVGPARPIKKTAKKGK